MEIIKNKVCGADIHKKFLVATILSKDGTQISERFGMMLDDILKFKEWVIANNCEQVAVESTGVYWVPIYTALEDKIEVIVANPYQIKHTPGRKTDKVDSEWIAELCLKGMIEPSRIFPKEDRELRTLTRARENLVNNRTQMKNRIHQILEYSCIKTSSVLSDIFGKSGRYLLDGLVRQEAVSEIVDQPTPFPFGVSPLWHAFLVTGGCEAHRTKWKRMEP
jgi:transposase